MFLVSLIDLAEKTDTVYEELKVESILNMHVTGWPVCKSLLVWSSVQDVLLLTPVCGVLKHVSKKKTAWSSGSCEEISFCTFFQLSSWVFHSCFLVIKTFDELNVLKVDTTHRKWCGLHQFQQFLFFMCWFNLSELMWLILFPELFVFVTLKKNAVVCWLLPIKQINFLCSN